MENARTGSDKSTDPTPVHRRYLLVTSTPSYLDASGAIWLERSWHHDFVAHLEYLKDFVNCAPCLVRGDEPDLVRLEVPPDMRVRFVHLPPQTSFLVALLNLPRTAAALWRAIGRADIVHSHVVGWPYPLGWIANPFALLRRRRLLINVESDWQLGAPGRSKLKHGLLDMDPLRSWMARWSCEHAHLALFTHANYRDALCRGNLGHAYVSPAVWVNEADMLDASAAESTWESKMRKPVRLLFAGRLVEAKGVKTLLAALRELDQRGVVADVDVIGRGEERVACLETAARLHSIRLSVLDPVPYGAAFFSLLRSYHAMLVPSLTEEQPRIVFDANAQAVPVIASETKGLRPYVADGKTGWLVRAGDPTALATTIERAGASPSELRRMGLAALRVNRGRTHQSMHRWRSRLISEFCT